MGAYEEILDDGFWLSRMSVHGLVRMRASSLHGSTNCTFSWMNG